MSENTDRKTSRKSRLGKYLVLVTLIDLFLLTACIFLLIKNIYDKKTDFILLGEDNNGDGKYDYRHHVDYWMPFNEGVGLHDASWRKNFGGDVYLTKGSGGCVNLKRESAAALYRVIHVGDKVIVHD